MTTKKMQKKTAGRWGFSAGRYGHKVRVYERGDRPGLWLCYTGADGKKVQNSLGHSDKVRAKQECRELALVLESQEARPVRRLTPEFEPRTLEQLLDQYEAEESPTKGGTGPQEDKRRRKVWSEFFRLQGVVWPDELDDSHVQSFIRLRRHGDLRVDGVDLPEPAPPARRGERREAVVTPRTIDADLVFLNRVFNWAAGRKEGAQPLLDRKPVKLPRLRTRNPKRPMATRDDHQALRRNADTVCVQRLFRGFLALLDGLGWRVSAICGICGSDIDFTPAPWHPHGRIRKNHLVDKNGVGDWIPMSRYVAAAVRRVLARSGVPEGEPRYLFSAPRRRGRPWSRYHVRDMLDRAERQSGIPHIGGAHCYRRKWFSERKDYPVADLMKAGGHADPETIRLYQQPDPITTYEVVSRPTRRLKSLPRNQSAA